MARITRNKAAEILGLSRQTISNYIEQGLIGSCVGEHGILYVNSEDVEKYAQKYKMLAANEKMIDDKLKEVEAHKRAINVELTELRNRATANGKLAANAVGMLFGVINAMSYLGITPKLSYRESKLLKDIINGMTYDELSLKYGVSATRIRQIVEKTCNKLTYNEDAAIAEIATNQDLRIVIDGLKKKLKATQASYDEYRRAKGDTPIGGTILPPLILGKDVNDCGFPVRILNMFRWCDVYTVGDLLRKFHGKSDLDKIRNIGKKSIWIILDFIEENNLSFKQNGESDEDFYIRLNNNLTKNMKKMIKKVLGFVTIGNVSLLLVVVIGVFYIFINRFEPAILCMFLAVAIFFVNFLYRECDEALELADKCKDNERDAVQETIWLYDELQLEMQRHRLTAIQGMKYNNKAEFMQRKKSLTQYLKYSDAIDNIYEQEVERLHKMEKEIEKKNNDGKDKGTDSETETAKSE